MTLQDESRLSFYKELTVLDNKNNIVLVQNIIDKEIFVKKTLNIYSTDIYEQLINIHILGIPEIKECIKDNNSLIVIEEYIQGRNLKQIMEKNGTFNEQDVYSIAVKLANILAHLQTLTPPIIHRDIKPSNIIIDKIGHIYLIDFNAARHVSDDKIEDTRMLGTVYFAAPEQYGFGQSDERTDIYGFGATINYLLTGDKPGAGIANCIYSDIIKKCLMLDASNRYQSAEELLNSLENVYNQSANTSKTNDTYQTDSNTNSAYEHTTTSNNAKKSKNKNIKYKINNKHNINNITKTITYKVSELYNNYIYKKLLIDSSWRKYLLPGFRSLNPIRCSLAAIWYLLIIFMTATITVTAKEGMIITGYELFIYRLATFIIFFGETLWFGNYLNIRRKLPGMKKINVLSFLLMFVYGAVFLFITIILLALCVV